jgi:hypothetical protein
MKQKSRRTAGVSWKQWHRMAVLRSLKMMVISGVVRRADLDPPLVRFDSAAGGRDRQRGDRTYAGSMAEPGWLARLFFSREYLLRRHH